MRTHHCGALQTQHVGQEVRLCGWVQTMRHKGPLIWIDLRDRHGLTQITLEKEHCPAEVWTLALGLQREDVVQVAGHVVLRQDANPELFTGEIEVLPKQLKRLNTSEHPPFLIKPATDGGEALRMRYRYLDLRRAPVHQALVLRHQVMQATRAYLDTQGCIEIETPLLVKSTPEGAKDFVVPSSRHPGYYYALPQSPQLLKQLLMVGGLDRYYQIAKCFRDEDARADRQIEFTQIDCECSFMSMQEIMALFEGLVRTVFQRCKQHILPDTLPILTYHEAMERYGSDRPDLRWQMQFKDVTNLFRQSNFAPLATRDKVIALRVPQGAGLSRKALDQLVQTHRAQYPTVEGPFFVKQISEQTCKSSLDKHYGPSTWAACRSLLGLATGDLMVMVAGDGLAVYEALGKLRLAFPALLSMQPNSAFAALWVIDFPLLQWNQDTQRYEATHHPFTAPKEEDLGLLDAHPEQVRAQAYDFVINGVEIGGGSIRIHTKALQEHILYQLGYSPETIKQQFGFLIEALSFGAPPHGGFAIGLARLCQMLGGEDSIRAYIAFPKNNAGRDTMMQAPAPLSE